MEVGTLNDAKMNKLNLQFRTRYFGNIWAKNTDFSCTKKVYFSYRMKKNSSVAMPPVKIKPSVPYEQTLVVSSKAIFHIPSFTFHFTVSLPPKQASFCLFVLLLLNKKKSWNELIHYSRDGINTLNKTNQEQHMTIIQTTKKPNSRIYVFPWVGTLGLLTITHEWVFFLYNICYYIM